jgi:hypothetical protein
MQLSASASPIQFPFLTQFIKLSIPTVYTQLTPTGYQQKTAS